MSAKRVGLLVVDVQKAYQTFRCSENSSRLFGDSVDRAMWAIQPTIALFRERKQPVFFVQHTDQYVAEGSDGFQLADGLNRLETEYQIVKRHSNSFFKTNLAEKLRHENVGFVVICGLSAGGCVDATVQGAMENEFGVAVLQHGIAGLRDEHIQQTQYLKPVISQEALRFFLN